MLHGERIDLRGKLTLLAALTTPDRSVRLTVGKQGDEWSIGMNGAERFLIPEAIVVGG